MSRFQALLSILTCAAAPWAFRVPLLDEAGARGIELESHNFMARFHAE
jgi:hypothetical protein